MNCPKCGSFRHPEAIFCTSCGTRFQVQFCQTCHHPNPFSARFCVKCGTNLEAASVAPSNEERSSATLVNSAPESTFSDAGVRPVVSNADVRYAGFWARFAAYVIDQILLLIAVGIVGALFSLAFLGRMNHLDPELVNLFPDWQPGQALSPANRNLMALAAGWYYASILYGLARWLYFSVMEASSLQATLGKMLLGIKVTDMRGNRLKFGRAVGRYFAKYISNMTLSIGYIMAAGTKRKQALHDLIAECLVVRK